MSLLVVCRRRLLVPAIVLSLSVLPGAATIAAAGKAPHTPVVQELVTLLEVRPPVREALEGAIRNAGLAGLDSTESLLAHLDDLVTAVPTEGETRPKITIQPIVRRLIDDVVELENTELIQGSWS